MRVAFITDLFLPSVNGIVTSTVSLMQGLTQRGHQVAVYYPSPFGKHTQGELETNAVLFPQPSFPALIYPSLRVPLPDPRLKQQLQTFNPHIVHVMSYGLLGIRSVSLVRKKGIPLIGTFHGYAMEPEYLKLIKLDQIQVVSEYAWKYVIDLFNKMDRVVALSEYISSDLLSHGLKSQIEIIPNGIDMQPIQTVSRARIAQMREQYRIGRQAILYVGRVSVEKNLDLLLEAFAIVHKQLPQAQLVIAGDGPVLKKHTEKSQILGLGHSVVFTGEIEHSKLLQSGLFQACSVFCTASMSEAQPMSIIEAMAGGLPIVGVKARGIQDMVSDNGILIPKPDATLLSQALLTLLTSKDKRMQMARTSLKVAKNYDRDAVILRIENLYQGVRHS